MNENEIIIFRDCRSRSWLGWFCLVPFPPHDQTCCILDMFSVSELKGILQLSQIVAIVLKIVTVGENLLPRAMQRFIKTIMLRWADQLPNK